MNVAKNKLVQEIIFFIQLLMIILGLGFVSKEFPSFFTEELFTEY